MRCTVRRVYMCSWKGGDVFHGPSMAKCGEAVHIFHIFQPPTTFGSARDPQNGLSKPSVVCNCGSTDGGGEPLTGSSIFR